jgi:hypothetical protein
MPISELETENTGTQTLGVSDLEKHESEHFLDDTVSHFSLVVGACGSPTWYN